MFPNLFTEFVSKPLTHSDHANMGPLDDKCSSPDLIAWEFEVQVWDKVKELLTDDALFDKGSDRSLLQEKLDHRISADQIDGVRTSRRKARFGLANPTFEDKRPIPSC